MTERVLINPIFGGRAYPDCENASMEGVVITDCLCTVLSNDPRASTKYGVGHYWCSVATTHGRCPLGRK